MSITITPKLDPLYGPQKAPQWQNVDFTTDGRHLPCPVVFDTEEGAKRDAEKFAVDAAAQHDESMRRYGLPLEIVDLDSCHLYWWPEYSHTLQLPADNA